MGTVIDSHFLGLTAIVTVLFLFLFFFFSLSLFDGFSCFILNLVLWVLFVFLCFKGGISVTLLHNHCSSQIRQSHWLCWYSSYHLKLFQIFFFLSRNLDDWLLGNCNKKVTKEEEKEFILFYFFFWKWIGGGYTIFYFVIMML